jgi:amino acid transporter
MSKDQAIGGAIFIVCIVVAIGYLVTLFFPAWLGIFGIETSDAALANYQFWIIAIPVFVAFVAIMFIGAWIGWTMATTPAKTNRRNHDRDRGEEGRTSSNEHARSTCRRKGGREEKESLNDNDRNKSHN